MTSRHFPRAGGGRLQALREHLRRQADDGQAWLELAQALAQAATQAKTRAPTQAATPAGAPDAELHHALEQAIKSLPEELGAWMLAASVHQRQRGLAAALQWLEHMARQNPQLAAPRLAAAALRADGLRQSGRWSQALAAYREVQESRPDDAWLLNNVGTCLASLERLGEASACFAKALQLDPDFAEARLNQAFLCACRSEDLAAVRGIDKVLQFAGLDPATRRAAETLRAILREHARLEPFLQQAVRSGSVAQLQEALARTPAGLGRPHAQTVAKLWSLARRCRDLPLDPREFHHAANAAALPLVEACAQCNLDGSGAVIARLQEELAQVPVDPAVAGRHGPLLNILEIIRERRARHAAVLQGPEGEAWLRYWHARLLRDTPEKRPGQYKVAANAIKSLPLTPAENVAGTLRVLLAEILPDLPGGPARGALLYIAVNMIHGFGDGNGRLSRFLLAWETESAGLPPIIIPPAVRAQMARALDSAWLEGELQPLREALRLAHAETGRLLSELQARGPALR